MPPWVVDVVMAALILGMTWALMSEGLWGAALMFFNVLFAAIITFNFYEPLALLMAMNATFMAGYADMLSMMLIFCVTLFILRITTETLAPAMVRFPTPLYHLGRVFFGLAGAVLTLTIVLLAFECAPVHKKVFTVVDYKHAPPFKMGLDREWLGFFQYTTGQIFANYNSGTRDPFREYGTARVFDPRSEWLLRHQDARPYGKETVLGEAEAGGAAGDAAGGGGGAGGAAGGGREGDPKVVGPGPGGGVVIPPP